MELHNIKERYQQMARMMAEGKSDKELAWVSGLPISDIQTLMDDPSFKESAAYYQQNVFSCKTPLGAETGANCG